VAPKPNGKLRVVTTIGILADWARQVGGDRVEVTSLLTGNESPHTYEAKPQDAALLARADILFRVGLGLEDWLGPVVENAGNRKLVIVDASAGIPDVITETGHRTKSEARSEKLEAGTSERRDRTKSEARAEKLEARAPVADAGPKSEVRNQKPEGRIPGSDSLIANRQSPVATPPTFVGGGNPHIWLDPELAKTGIENLVRELVRIDPKGESLYRAREVMYFGRIDSLSAAIAAGFSGLSDRRLVTYHDAWPYFARRFGLDIVASIEPIPGQEPSAKELARLVDLIGRERIKVITIEPQLPSALPDMLAKETGVKVVVLNPLESEGGYIAALGNSARALVDALK